MFFRHMTTAEVESAVVAAMRPTDKTPVTKKVRDLADAITRAAAPGFDQHGRPVMDPIPSREIAVKATTLAPTGGVTPETIELAMHRQGIDFAEPFAPGKPLVPYYGYDRRPRRYNYLTGRNIDTSVRDGRVPFATLGKIIDGYDIAEICVRHTINDLRSMPLEFRPLDGHMKDAGKEIEEAKRFLRHPDGYQPFVTWFAQWANDVFRYDAGCLWRQRSANGRVSRLRVVDGTTILPVVDYYGDVPDGAAPAFQQVIEGLPWIDFNRDDLIYLPQWPQSNSVYGKPAIETVLLNANTDVRLQMFFLGFFSEGTVPEMLLTAPPDMSSPDDLAELQETWDDWYANNQSGRHGARWIPAGSQPYPYKQIQQLNPQIAEYVMRRTCAAFGRTPQDLGITSNVNRACYSQDTETLTERGWKHYWEVEPGEKIATLNPDNGHIEFHEPAKLYVYPYDGDMVRFHSNQVDVCVTPDHKMWVKRRRTGTRLPLWEKTEAQNLESGGDVQFAATGGWNAPEVDRFILPRVDARTRKTFDRTVPMDLWLEFLGYVISEGCIYQPKDVPSQRGRYVVQVSQSHRVYPDKAERIDRCLAALPVNFHRHEDADGMWRWQVSDKSLWTWLVANVGRTSGDKRVPQFARNVGKRQLTILMDALMLGDGYTPKHANATCSSYATKSALLAGDVQEIAMKLGMRARITSGTRCLRVAMRPGDDYQIRPSLHVSREHYEGIVWCFNVPNHLFVTRRNGKIGIHGNTSDTQVDVEFRISTVPNTEYFEAILNDVLQGDLALPVAVKFDDGREKEDRLVEAQAHKIYVEIGAESPDEVRGNILGLPVDNANRVPRMFDSARLGPVPLAYLYEASGVIDPRTLSPEPGSHPTTVPFMNIQEQLPGINQDHAATATLSGPQTGPGGRPNTPRTPKAAAKAVKAELAAFKRFTQGRTHDGRWRQFHFETVDTRMARELNRRGRAEVARTHHQVIAGGLAVVARDTGRLVILQRADDPDDPAGGTWELPGGHLEGAETPKQAAYREWQEETGVLLPYVPWEPDTSYTASNGIYQGFVWLLDSEADIDLAARDVINPDDPDGDVTEAVRWASRADLLAEPDLRPELRTDLALLLASIDQALSEPVGKATDPKGQGRRARPGSRYEQALVAYYTTQLTGAIGLGESAAALAVKLLALFAVAGAFASPRLIAAHVQVDTDALGRHLHNLYADAYLAGAKDTVDDLGSDLAADAPARRMVDDVDWASWKPGSNVRPPLSSRGFAELLAGDGVTIKGIDDVTRDRIGGVVAEAIRGGWSTARTTAAIDQVLHDPARAELIAVTEVNRAMSAAAIDIYRQNGAEAWDLITADDPCPICAGIAAANPHPITDTEIPPEHPRCRCSLSQHVE